MSCMTRLAGACKSASFLRVGRASSNSSRLLGILSFLVTAIDILPEFYTAFAEHCHNICCEAWTLFSFLHEQAAEEID